MKLKVHGQGVFLFKTVKEVFIHFYNEENNGITFGISYLGVNVKYKDELLPQGNKGLSTLEGAYYWISLDSQNQKVMIGIGEPRLETMVYNYEFTNEKAFLETITQVTFEETLTPIDLLKDPVVTKVPLFVKGKMSLHSLAKGNHFPHSNLSMISQRLYNCVVDTKLNESFKLGKAIEKSIKTGWCYNKLKSKENEFGNDPNMTYLRITLGQNNGESPGVAYVMEIWPPGHYSPIHSHAGANAIIKVLRGEINVSLYPFLNKSVPAFGNETFKKGDLTWISPTLNQTHQLKNLGKKTCVTIQCYMYPENDKTHYDYFDYIDTSGVEKNYTPDSDCSFLEFVNLMKKEN